MRQPHAASSSAGSTGHDDEHAPPRGSSRRGSRAAAPRRRTRASRGSRARSRAGSSRPTRRRARAPGRRAAGTSSTAPSQPACAYVGQQADEAGGDAHDADGPEQRRARPIRSPMCPKIAAPMGRTTNATPIVANAASVPPKLAERVEEERPDEVGARSRRRRRSRTTRARCRPSTPATRRTGEVLDGTRWRGVGGHGVGRCGGR